MLVQHTWKQHYQDNKMNYALTQEISNQTEHLRIVNENLTIANEWLTDVLKKTDEEKEKLSELSQALRLKGEEYSQFIVAMDNLLESKARTATGIITEAEEIKDKAVKEASQIIQDAIRFKDDVLSDVRELQDVLIPLRNERRSLLDTNPELKLEREKLLKELAVLSSMLQTISDSVNNKEKTKDILNAELEQINIYIGKKLQETKELLAVEAEKVKLPNKLLDERKKELDARDKNLRILRNRIENRFKKLFPNSNIA